ncbi:MAG: Ig-like domain-containing protein [Gemmatimonadetes bacterium]|nr:Ig-like domain-containing protein [Gemmatimonadota bacterium]
MKRIARGSSIRPKTWCVIPALPSPQRRAIDPSALDAATCRACSNGARWNGPSPGRISDEARAPAGSLPVARMRGRMRMRRSCRTNHGVRMRSPLPPPVRSGRPCTSGVRARPPAPVTTCPAPSGGPTRHRGRRAATRKDSTAAAWALMAASRWAVSVMWKRGAWMWETRRTVAPRIVAGQRSRPRSEESPRHETTPAAGGGATAALAYSPKSRRSPDSSALSYRVRGSDGCPLPASRIVMPHLRLSTVWSDRRVVANGVVRAALPALVVAILACGDGAAPPQSPGGVADITIVPASALLTVGETRQFTATPRTATGDTTASVGITWSSSAPNVASVSAVGRVTATAVGEATIVASAGAYRAEAACGSSRRGWSTSSSPPIRRSSRRAIRAASSRRRVLHPVPPKSPSRQRGGRRLRRRGRLFHRARERGERGSGADQRGLRRRPEHARGAGGAADHRATRAVLADAATRAVDADRDQLQRFAHAPAGVERARHAGVSCQAVGRDFSHRRTLRGRRSDRRHLRCGRFTRLPAEGVGRACTAPRNDHVYRNRRHGEPAGSPDRASAPGASDGRIDRLGWEREPADRIVGDGWHPRSAPGPWRSPDRHSVESPTHERGARWSPMGACCSFRAARGMSRSCRLAAACRADSSCRRRSSRRRGIAMERSSTRTREGRCDACRRTASPPTTRTPMSPSRRTSFVPRRTNDSPSGARWRIRSIRTPRTSSACRTPRTE